MVGCFGIEGKNILILFGFDLLGMFEFFQTLAGAFDRKALIVQHVLDLRNALDVLTLVQTLFGTRFDGCNLWKLGLPVAQNIRLNTHHLCDFADFKVEFVGNCDVGHETIKSVNGIR